MNGVVPLVALLEASLAAKLAGQADEAFAHCASGSRRGVMGGPVLQYFAAETFHSCYAACGRALDCAAYSWVPTHW